MLRLPSLRKQAITSIFWNQVRSLETKTVASLLKLGDTALTSDDEVVLERVRVVGWLKSMRDKKNIKFLHLHDGSDCRHLQLIVALSDLQRAAEASTTQIDTNYDKLFDSMHHNAAIEAIGSLVKSTHKMQSVELRVDELRLIGACEPAGYPFQANASYTLEQLRPHVHMRCHTDLFAAVMRFRSELVAAFHHYFYARNFVQVHTPIITTNDCEGGCETFKVATADSEKTPASLNAEKFFGKSVFLTASAQLHLETMTTTLSRVYTLSPTFRAEKSLTRHHMAEFYMLEAEAIDMNELDQLLDLVEEMIKQVGRRCFDNPHTKRDIDFIHATHGTDGAASKSKSNKNESKANKKKPVAPPPLVVDHVSLITETFTSDRPFVRITYAEAIKTLNATKRLASELSFGDDINKEQEKLLVEHFANTPVFVTHYPKKMKPFYMRTNERDPTLVDNFDLLAPFVGEIVGGSLREHRVDVLAESLREQGLASLGVFDEYLQTKKQGGMRMGGFGLGLDRLIQFMLHIQNIRDTCAFPRTLYECKM